MNNITEEHVIEFLRQRAACYGIPGLVLACESSNRYGRPWTATVPDIAAPALDVHGFGSTVADAVANLVPHIKTRAQAAAELRAKADQLEKEAAT